MGLAVLLDRWSNFGSVFFEAGVALETHKVR